MQVNYKYIQLQVKYLILEAVNESISAEKLEFSLFQTKPPGITAAFFIKYCIDICRKH